MKKRRGKRHTPEQIIRKLREADAMLAAEKTIGQVVQSLEISETMRCDCTFCHTFVFRSLDS